MIPSATATTFAPSTGNHIAPASQMRMRTHRASASGARTTWSSGGLPTQPSSRRPTTEPQAASASALASGATRIAPSPLA